MNPSNSSRIRISALPSLLIIMLYALIGCAPAPATVEATLTQSATRVLDTATPTPKPTKVLTATPTLFVPKAVIKDEVDKATD